MSNVRDESTEAGLLNEAKLLSWLSDTFGWATEDVSLSPIAGTHHNFKLSYQSQNSPKSNDQLKTPTTQYLAKIWRAHPGECFSMDSTARLQRHLAQFGVATPLVAVDPEAGIWLERWVDAESMPRCPITLGRRLATLHNLPIQCARKVDVATQNLRLQLPHDDLPTRHVAPHHPLNGLIFGHMDAQYAHGLGDQIWIDWEYAGMTQRGCDLANAIVINQMNADETQQCLAEYCANTGLDEDVLATGLPAYIHWVDKQNQSWESTAPTRL